MLMGTGIIAMYYLGRAFWQNQQDRAADNSKDTAGEGAGPGR
ncbi:hypothetical protein ACWDE9_43170 [Streptomyces olivaceoviridis]